MARRDKKENDGMKRQKEKMARGDNKKKRVIPFLWAYKKPHPYPSG